MLRPGIVGMRGRVYGHTTTAMRDNEHTYTPLPLPPPHTWPGFIHVCMTFFFGAGTAVDVTQGSARFFWPAARSLELKAVFSERLSLSPRGARSFPSGRFFSAAVRSLCRVELLQYCCLMFSEGFLSFSLFRSSLSLSLSLSLDEIFPVAPRSGKKIEWLKK